MAKMRITFKGFEKMATRLDVIGGTDYMKKAVDEALTETQRIVRDNLIQAVARYARKGGGAQGYATPEMALTVKQNVQIEWAGSVAVVHVGFNLTEPGGFHSIFVMYGTPRMKPDKKIYNAVFGAKTKKQIAEAQKKIFAKYLGLDG